MKKKNRKPYTMIQRGNVKIPLYKRVQRKGKRRYTTFIVSEQTFEKRKLWTFADVQEAKAKAIEIAEVAAHGDPHLISFAALKRPIQNALETIAPTGLRIDHACRLVADACEIISPSKFLDACRLFKTLEPDKPFTPKHAKDAVKEYLALPKKVGWKRINALSAYFNIFVKGFGEKLLHEVDAVEFKDFVDNKKWKPKTYNEFLRGISILYREAQFRHWVPATCNPTAQIKRLRETDPEIGILEPKECKQLLNRLAVIAPDLVPVIAIWAFSGIRLEEIGRMDWPQIRRGLETGIIVMEAWQTKKQKRRSVPVMTNLRLWLTRFGKQDGHVLPDSWLRPTKTSGNRLSELPRFIRRKTGCRWRANWGRHSYATYFFKKIKDPGQLVKMMGNSLKDFERNYWSKVDSVTDSTAVE